MLPMLSVRDGCLLTSMSQSEIMVTMEGGCASSCANAVWSYAS
jgi:hypothetical protein